VADDRAVSGRGPAGPPRRALLVVSAAALPVLLTACKGIQVLGTPPAPPADVDVLRDAIDREAALVAHYTAVLAGRGVAGSAGSRGPGGSAGSGGSGGSGGSAGSGRTSAGLAAVLSDHRQHLEQLRSRLVEPAGVRSPAPPHSPAASSGPAGGGAVLTMAQLERAEQEASDQLIARLGGLPPALAQLFASIAASEATHVPYLQAARRGR
jgi:hypothetical protein